MHDEIVTLQVGERRFMTSRATLTAESTYFASHFSWRWPYSKPDDGTHFVDADPTIFEHILRYMRHGTFPLFYDRTNGFDYGLYNLLMREAECFGMGKLKDWIATKRYLQAITVEHMADIFEGCNGDSRLGMYIKILDSSMEELYFPSWKNVKEYQCPRDIEVHHGDLRRCGKACEKARGEDDLGYKDVQVLHTLVITKRTVINHDICG